MEAGQIFFRYGGVEAHAVAEGEWPGVAYVQWEYLFRLAKRPPLNDPVVVTVDATHLKVEGAVCPCRWAPAAPRAVHAFINEPPAPRRGRDTTFLTLVSMGIDYTPDRIASLDLTIPVEKARMEKDRMNREAAHILAPLEITSDDLKMLVLKTLGRRMKA